MVDDSNKRSNIGFGQEIDVLEMKKRTLSGALIIYAFLVLMRLAKISIRS